MMDVYLLCADWCGTCCAIKPEWVDIALPGFAFHWIDIEDQADAMQDIEITDFPTVVVADAQGQIHFAGTVEPRTAQLQKLLRAKKPESSYSKEPHDWAGLVRSIRSTV